MSTEQKKRDEAPDARSGEEPEVAGGGGAGGDAADREEPVAAVPGGRPEDAAHGEPPPETPEQQVAQLRDKWLRAKAEAENVRRKSAQETLDARRYGAAATLLGLLDVLDNLQRALATPPEGTDETFLTGLRLIEQQFLGVLEAHGVTPVPAEPGMAPDPMLHRALVEQPSDEVAPGRILVVAVPGYKLHDRLLREAQVVVARAPGAPRAGGDGEA